MASELKWRNVVIATEMPELNGLYEASRAAYFAAKAARQAFEKAMQDSSPHVAGNELKFSYLKGFAIAYGPISEKKTKKASQPKLSLNEWLEQQATL